MATKRKKRPIPPDERLIVLDVTVTRDEETVLDLMHMEYQEEPDAKPYSLAEFAGFLLRKHIDAYRQECGDACRSEGLVPR